MKMTVGHRAHQRRDIVAALEQLGAKQALGRGIEATVSGVELVKHGRQLTEDQIRLAPDGSEADG